MAGAHTHWAPPARSIAIVFAGLCRLGCVAHNSRRHKRCTKLFPQLTAATKSRGLLRRLSELEGTGHAVAIHSGCWSWRPARTVAAARASSSRGVGNSRRHFCRLDDIPTVASVGSRNQRIYIAGHTPVQLSRSTCVIQCSDSIGVTDSLGRLYPPDVARWA